MTSVLKCQSQGLGKIRNNVINLFEIHKKVLLTNLAVLHLINIDLLHYCHSTFFLIFLCCTIFILRERQCNHSSPLKKKLSLSLPNRVIMHSETKHIFLDHLKHIGKFLWGTYLQRTVTCVPLMDKKQLHQHVS